jgi:hypothetical protein
MDGKYWRKIAMFRKLRNIRIKIVGIRLRFML